jgi:hypothetical protein
MSDLTAVDLEMFAKLRILPKLLEHAGIVRVTDREARETYGISGGGDMAGIAFPYFDPGTMSNGRRRTYVRIRRDHPEPVENGKPTKKYVCPYGDRKRVYFPPTSELFADVTVPIVWVEAEKSVLAREVLNNGGALGGWADTATIDPLCSFDYPDCYAAHAFVWQNGAKADLGVRRPNPRSAPPALGAAGGSRQWRMLAVAVGGRLRAARGARFEGL